MPGSPAVNSRAVACAGSYCGVRASGSSRRSTIRWPSARRFEVADAAAYALRLPDRAANPVIHDQLSVLFRDIRPHPRFRTPAVSFDISQRDLRDGVTLAPAGEAAATVQPAGLTWRPLRGAPGLTFHLVLPREQSPLHRRVRAVAKSLAHELRWLPG